MTCKITIAMNDAAFDGDPIPELERCIRDAIARLKRDGIEKKAGAYVAIMSTDGNKVGELNIATDGW